MLCPKSLLPHPNWLHISNLQFKTQGFDFHTEPVLMHSPLLKESLWVSHPPPTYMLKFSGLADLSSCIGSCTGISPVHMDYFVATKLQRPKHPSTTTSARQANNTLSVSRATARSDTQRHTTSYYRACSCCMFHACMNA